MKGKKLSFGVSLNKEENLRQKMKHLSIFEKDIVEKFIRSSGKGGQKVNKTSTCVYLKHLPTMTEVKCQRERTQALNRYLARRILADKIEAKLLERESQEQKRIEKMRRQKRKRSRRAKLKILEEKRKHSLKKEERSLCHKLDDLEE